MNVSSHCTVIFAFDPPLSAFYLQGLAIDTNFPFKLDSDLQALDFKLL